jgi:hypothetical protein
MARRTAPVKPWSVFRYMPMRRVRRAAVQPTGSGMRLSTHWRSASPLSHEVMSA